MSLVLSSNEVELFFQKIGSGTPIVILHGLYGSSDNWISVARQLAVAHTVYLIDQRNHGRSPHSPEHSYNLMSNDLYGFFTHQHIENAIILGHSMGGKTAMLFSARYPEKIKGLIIVDIAPASYASLNEYSPQVITHLNIVNAMLSFDFSLYSTRTEIDNELAKTIPDDDIRQFIMKNVHRNPDHSFDWKLNTIAISKALPEIMGSIYLEKELNNKPPLQFPSLFIRGGRSNYLLPVHYPEIKTYFTNSQIETIPNAGHWVHAEQPVLFRMTITEFIKKTDG
jgi:pimeloyl-ACP methyl ester carboxylesterase